MSEQVTLDMKCLKCNISLRRQILMAMMIDAGAQTLDPCLCPEGGDHDFVDNKAALSKAQPSKQSVGKG